MVMAVVIAMIMEMVTRQGKSGARRNSYWDWQSDRDGVGGDGDDDQEVW